MNAPSGVQSNVLTHNRILDAFQLSGLRRARSAAAPLVGLRGLRVGGDSRDDRLRDDLPAPLAGASGARPASARQPLLPLLAVAHDGHGDEGMGGDPPQASR